MKILKTLTTIIVLLSFFTSPIPQTFAQDNEEVTVDTLVGEEEKEEEKDSTEEITEEDEKEEQKTLLEPSKVEVQPRYTWETILLAILIPLIFVIFIYLIFKLFKF